MLMNFFHCFTNLAVESCSSDILRNALRSYIGIEIISVDEEGKLSIKNKNKLYEIIHTLSVCKL